jgi:hypothetical protein
VPPSSLFCRTLWKSYLFNCRTKLAKLLCLKCLGRIDFVNFSFCHCRTSTWCPTVALLGSSRTSSTTKLSPSSPHLTTEAYEGSSSILNQDISILRSAYMVFGFRRSGGITNLYNLRTCETVSTFKDAGAHSYRTHEVARVVGRSRATGSIHPGTKLLRKVFVSRANDDAERGVYTGCCTTPDRRIRKWSR